MINKYLGYTKPEQKDEMQLVSKTKNDWKQNQFCTSMKKVLKKNSAIRDGQKRTETRC